ncbi:hypothetical protein LINGRAHAP2_LOCUS3901 [Linum grandiflorum]
MGRLRMSTRKKQKTRGASSSSAPPPVNIEEEPAAPVHQRQRRIDGSRAPPPLELAREIFNFLEGSYESRQYATFSQWPVELQGYIPLAEYEDWGWFDSQRAYCERAGIWELVAFHEPILPHVAREFYTTLAISIYSSTSERDAIQFRLGGRPFKISVDQFGVAMGFYTQSQMDREDLVKLAVMEKKDIPDRKAFWREILVDPRGYNPGRSKAMTMIKPMLRLLHLLFRRAITTRRTGNTRGVVSTKDLWIFYYLEKEKKVHQVELLVQSFRHWIDSGTVTFMYGAGYISRLVSNLGVRGIFGDNPMIALSFPITVGKLAAHRVRNLLDEKCDPGEVAGDREEEFPTPDADVLCAAMENMQLTQGDILDT